MLIDTHTQKQLEAKAKEEAANKKAAETTEKEAKEKVESPSKKSKREVEVPEEPQKGQVLDDNEAKVPHASHTHIRHIRINV